MPLGGVARYIHSQDLYTFHKLPSSLNYHLGSLRVVFGRSRCVLPVTNSWDQLYSGTDGEMTPANFIDVLHRSSLSSLAPRPSDICRGLCMGAARSQIDS